MKYSKIVHRLEGSGYKAWDVHGKAKAMLAQGADVLLLTIGDPDFTTPHSNSKAERKARD